jgi:hypothetical protein
MLISSGDERFFSAIVRTRWAPEVRLIFGKGVVWITVKPAFAWLGGGNHRMSTGARVFAGVLIRRAVAAKGYSTCLARPQMDPM